MASKKIGLDWLENVRRQLGHTCNGTLSQGEHEDHVVCRMNNGTVSASVADDGTRMLTVRKTIGEKVQKLSMESHTDEMVVTQSLSGSIEFLHRMGDSPEVRIEQVGKGGKMLGDIKINTYNDKVKTSLYAYL